MFFIRLLSRLSLPVLYKISDFLFFVSFYLVRYRRHLVATNLALSFPEKTESERGQIEREFYRNLCDYAVESLKLLTISKEELGRRMRFTDPSMPHRFKKANQSILFLASHQFNWEWLLVSASASFPIPVDFVYQPVKSKFVNSLILNIRTRFGAHPIKRDEVARELVKRKSILRCIASVADQYPGYGRDKKFITQFLNRETAFFMGTNQLAQLTQYPSVYMKPIKVRRGYYEASPVIIALPPYPKESTAVISNYVESVEEVIREYPAGWLWSHNRWKKRHLRS
ncbi:MAG TPA: lysophospholipid acyltransferase family protein [Chryseosolibacter sp.]|nr:lysophospholipid acyltransferase family protein [Chryseosolibacter sp.]